MKLLTAKTKFVKRIAAAGISVNDMTVKAGIEAMFDFYADERADGCEIEDDGDMLLFQWGTNDWGDGEAFEVSITRQLTATNDDPRQLALTFRFDPAYAPKGASEGNRWCESPKDLDEFRRFVAESKAMEIACKVVPESVELRYTRT